MAIPVARAQRASCSASALADPPALVIVAHDHRDGGGCRVAGDRHEFGHADGLLVVRLGRTRDQRQVCPDMARTIRSASAQAVSSVNERGEK